MDNIKVLKYLLHFFTSDTCGSDAQLNITIDVENSSYTIEDKQYYPMKCRGHFVIVGKNFVVTCLSAYGDEFAGFLDMYTHKVSYKYMEHNSICMLDSHLACFLDLKNGVIEL